MKLSIIVPCYNNENEFCELLPALKGLKQEFAADIMIQLVFVDDGSTDNSWSNLMSLKQELIALYDIKLLKLTGNFGSYSAFLAGLNYSDGNCFAQLHMDLQDPPEHLPEMFDLWKSGIKLVIGQRVSREENFTYTILAKTYHGLVRTFALPHIPPGGYDLILFDKEIRDNIVKMNETNINLVYLISWLKYPYAIVPIVRKKRLKGQSGWTFIKREKLVVDTIVGFSYAPIRIVSFTAIVLSILTICTGIYGLLSPIFGARPSQFFFLLLFLLFAFNLIMITLAVIAEYLWRTLENARRRPSFVVDKEA